MKLNFIPASFFLLFTISFLAGYRSLSPIFSKLRASASSTYRLVSSTGDVSSLQEARTGDRLPFLFISKLQSPAVDRNYPVDVDPKDSKVRSRYLRAYEEAIKPHEASLMAEDMGLAALHLSWRTERANLTEKCKLDLDEKWAQRIQLCRQRATPIRRAYEAIKKTCKEDLKTGCAAAAKELSKRQTESATQ